jgi:hypothetical protein
MKYSPTVSSSRRKSRAAHFKSDSEARRKLMSSHLAKELRTKYNVSMRPPAPRHARKCVSNLYLTGGVMYLLLCVAGARRPHPQGR